MEACAAAWRTCSLVVIRAVVKVLQVLSDPVHRLDDGRGHVGRTVMLRVIRDLLPLADVARISDIIGGQRIVHLAQHAVRVGGKRVGRFQARTWSMMAAGRRQEFPCGPPSSAL